MSLSERDEFVIKTLTAYVVYEDACNRGFITEKHRDDYYAGLPVSKKRIISLYLGMKTEIVASLADRFESIPNAV